MTHEDPAVDTFIRLFRGRGDAYGSWTGGCIREPLTPDHFESHLYSTNPAYWIGVYNVIGDRCSWGCVDIDQPDWVLSHHIHTRLLEERIPSHVERTTRGYHVWVFPEDRLIPAWIMRRALIRACQLVNYDPKEVFPKQETATGYGNYVRLPLNGSMAVKPPKDCRRFVNDRTLAQRDGQRALTADLERLAVQVEVDDPQDVDIPVDLDAGLDVEEDVLAIGGHVLRLWRDGPRGRDRSNTLAQLAHRLNEKDVDVELAFRIVASADERWGKRFLNRGPNGVGILQRLVANAYGRT